MAGVIDVPKPRVNCSMLSQYTNRPVCFVDALKRSVSPAATLHCKVETPVTSANVPNFQCCFSALTGSPNRKDVHCVGWRGKGGHSRTKRPREYMRDVLAQQCFRLTQRGHYSLVPGVRHECRHFSFKTQSASATLVSLLTPIDFCIGHSMAWQVNLS